MAAKLIVPGLYGLRLGTVNAFLFETDDTLALIFGVACFGHGRPVLKNAAQKFRRKWAKEEL